MATKTEKMEALRKSIDKQKEELERLENEEWEKAQAKQAKADKKALEAFERRLPRLARKYGVTVADLLAFVSTDEVLKKIRN